MLQHSCEVCGRANGYAGICYSCKARREREKYQIMTAAVILPDGAVGTLYMEHCPNCRTIALFHQQT